MCCKRTCPLPWRREWLNTPRTRARVSQEGQTSIYQRLRALKNQLADTQLRYTEYLQAQEVLQSTREQMNPNS